MKARRGLLRDVHEAFDLAIDMCGSFHPDDIAPQKRRLGRLRAEVLRELRVDKQPSPAVRYYLRVGQTPGIGFVKTYSGGNVTTCRRIADGALSWTDESIVERLAAAIEETEGKRVFVYIERGTS